MNIENLYIEVTRNCTIECEHCLRGNKERKNIDYESLDRIFKDIKEIDTLLLSGGEPLINKKALEDIILLIKKYNVKINRIGIITNGTICSNIIIKLLNELKKETSKLEMVVTSDIFHREEIRKYNLENKVKRNYLLFNKLFGAKLDLTLDNTSYTLNKKGRAKYLNIDKINEMTKNRFTKFKFVPVPKDNRLEIINDNVEGHICVDVNGNIVDYGLSFIEEDLFSTYSYNDKDRSFSDSIKEYVTDYRERNSIVKNIYQK